MLPLKKGAGSRIDSDSSNNKSAGLVVRKTCVASLVGDRGGKPVNQAGPSGWAVSTGEVQPVLAGFVFETGTVRGSSVFKSMLFPAVQRACTSMGIT